MGGIEDEWKAAETTEQWSVDAHPGGTCVPQSAPVGVRAVGYLL